MITRRAASERGRTEISWLDSRHTFSFGEYHDPGHMGFRALRVINEDRVSPGQGFAPHSHRDMEIISYVLEGSLEHKDSLGNGSIIRPDDVQRMSAGTGVTHSEYNSSPTEPVHFLQVWIRPREQGLPASYEQRTFAADARQGRLRLVASPDGRDGSVTIHQDVDLYAGLLAPARQVAHPLLPGRHAWIQVARGIVEVGGTRMQAGDGAAISAEEGVRVNAIEPAEVLLFDLA